MTTSDKRDPVTVIGLGMMGTALATAFLNAGHPTTVWNRSAGKAGDLLARGAVRAITVADAVTAGQVVVLCVLDNQAARQILESAGETLTGRVVVNLTNGTPDQARELAAYAAARGADYLDGGIMAVPQMIAQPSALLLYSGSQEAFDTHRQGLESLGASRYLGTDPGLAALYDLALLTAMYGMFTGYFQAVALAGTERAGEFTAMVIPWVTAMMTSLPVYAKQIETGDYPTNVSSLTVNQAGFVNLLETARARDIDVSLITPLGALLDRAVAEGHGADSLARLVELIKNP